LVRHAAILNTYGNAESTEDAQRSQSDSTRPAGKAGPGEEGDRDSAIFAISAL